jgi:hypothetical protein
MRLVNQYIGAPGGDLNEFSHRTLTEFFPEFCGIDIDGIATDGTKRNRMVTILKALSPPDQAKLVGALLAKIPPNPTAFPTRTRELHDEFLAIAERLDRSAAVGSPRPAITSDVVERAIADAERLIETNGATSGVDRIHTMLHGYLQSVCDTAGIPYERGTTMPTLLNLLRERHPALNSPGPRDQSVTRILRAIGTVLDSLLPIRNEASMAHPNPLLGEAEAMLVIHSARTILHYLNAKLV